MTRSREIAPMITADDIARVTILFARLGLRNGQLWLSLVALNVRALEMWVADPDYVRHPPSPEPRRISLVREQGRPL
jgi:hypothetical protein